MPGIKIIKWVGFLALLIWVMSSACKTPEPNDTVDIAQALSSDQDDACFARADQPRSIEFPQDLGPHNRYKTEWWYYTGNLFTNAGRHFGYQLTFFRQAIDCVPPDKGEGRSDWRFNQLYFAHFAITDTQAGKFYSFQRMTRGSLGLAGAQAAPFFVWIDNWSAKAAPGQGEKASVILKARDQEQSGNQKKPSSKSAQINLTVTRTKPVILQGQSGWSKKGPGLSDASYYYSFPGMETSGELILGDTTHEVSGFSWFDHEWSTSALNSDVAGWDWFAIHFDSGPHKGMDLMVCQVRKADGSPNGYEFGSISFPDGRYTILGKDDFSIRNSRTWTSPESGRTYPSQWTIKIPGQELTFEVVPVMAGQEHTHMFTYYEGAVKVSSKSSSGFGHVEMTGY
ncbi:MAG: carotenoid 1,2-hydratase [Desulfobacterales bacterium]|nr:carotenoid 1,2-hydratase [Desulfobacterales bacterium]